MNEVYLVMNFADGTAWHIAVQLKVRTKDGERIILPTDANLEMEVARYTPLWFREGLTYVGWRRLSLTEHNLFAQDRPGEGSIYRDALTDNNGRIEHDMVKARNLHRERMRRVRGPLLLALDIDYLRAVEDKKEVEKVLIVAEKQALRDVTDDPAIEMAQTVEELKTVWPAILKD